MLGTGHRFGTGQAGQRLIAVPGQQQPGQVLAKPTPLGQSAEEIIEADGVRFQRMVMANFGCTPEGAWDIPVAVSQHARVKLRTVAEAVTSTATGQSMPAELQAHFVRAVQVWRADRDHVRTSMVRPPSWEWCRPAVPVVREMSWAVATGPQAPSR